MNVWLLMRFLISLRVAFNQCFLIFSANLDTSAKFLGSGMKWDTSELSETRNDTESGDKSDSKSIMMSEKDTEISMKKKSLMTTL